MSLRGWAFDVNEAETSVAVSPRLVVNTSEAAIDAAISGLGITRVLCYQIAQARRAGLLEFTLEDFEPTPFPISLVYAAQGLLPTKLRAFLDFAAPRLKTAMTQAPLNDSTVKTAPLSHDRKARARSKAAQGEVKPGRARR